MNTLHEKLKTNVVLRRENSVPMVCLNSSTSAYADIRSGLAVAYCADTEPSGVLLLWIVSFSAVFLSGSMFCNVRVACWARSIPPLQSCFSRGKAISLGGHGWEGRREKGDISYVNKDNKWEIVCFRRVCIKVEKKWMYPTGRKKQGWMIMSHREPHTSQIATSCSAEDGLPLCSCGVGSIQEQPC